jgi:hypothetical protein
MVARAVRHNPIRTIADGWADGQAFDGVDCLSLNFSRRMVSTKGNVLAGAKDDFSRVRATTSVTSLAIAAP